MNPLIQELMTSAGLQSSQAEGVLGLILAKARELLSSGDFEQLRKVLPDVDTLLTKAPDTKGGGFLGSLAGSLGGKAKLLHEMSQGLGKLNIPTDKAKPILAALQSGVSEHYPEATPLIQKALEKFQG